MFTGLIEAVVCIRAVYTRDEVRVIHIAKPDPSFDVCIGDSVAVHGVCLTVVRMMEDAFVVEVVAQTMSKTTFGQLEVGACVNVERALPIGARLGGHIVQGHVDGVLHVTAVAHGWITLHKPRGAPIIAQGSITLDGCSLTVAALDDTTFSIALIPHTRAHTTLGSLSPGDAVHVEYDMIGKYVASLMEPYVGALTEGRIPWTS
jgi:riboflavin synthase